VQKKKKKKKKLCATVSMPAAPAPSSSAAASPAAAPRPMPTPAASAPAGPRWNAGGHDPAANVDLNGHSLGAAFHRTGEATLYFTADTPGAEAEHREPGQMPPPVAETVEPPPTAERAVAPQDAGTASGAGTAAAGAAAAVPAQVRKKPRGPTLLSYFLHHARPLLAHSGARWQRDPDGLHRELLRVFQSEDQPGAEKHKEVVVRWLLTCRGEIMRQVAECPVELAVAEMALGMMCSFKKLEDDGNWWGVSRGGAGGGAGSGAGGSSAGGSAGGGSVRELPPDPVNVPQLNHVTMNRVTTKRPLPRKPQHHH
jgi:hypothetical protein